MANCELAFRKIVKLRSQAPQIDAQTARNNATATSTTNITNYYKNNYDNNAITELICRAGPICLSLCLCLSVDFDCNMKPEINCNYAACAKIKCFQCTLRERCVGARERGGKERGVGATLRLIYDWPGTYFDNGLRKWK